MRFYTTVTLATLSLVFSTPAWSAACPTAASGLEQGAQELVAFLFSNPADAETFEIVMAMSQWIEAYRNEPCSILPESGPLVRPLFRDETGLARLAKKAEILSAKILEHAPPQFIPFAQDLYETDWKDLNLSAEEARRPEAFACLYSRDQARLNPGTPATCRK